MFSYLRLSKATGELVVPTHDRGPKGAVLEEKAIAGKLNVLFVSVTSKGGSHMRPKVSPGLHQIKVSNKYNTWSREYSLKISK